MDTVFYYISIYYLFNLSVSYTQTHMHMCTHTQFMSDDSSPLNLPHGNPDADDIEVLELCKTSLLVRMGGH